MANAHIQTPDWLRQMESILEEPAPTRQRVHDTWAICAEREFVYGGSAGVDAECDFAKRFEHGNLTFTGDVLQVISVVGRQQKFGKLLICITVGP